MIDSLQCSANGVNTYLDDKKKQVDDLAARLAASKVSDDDVIEIKN